MNVRSISFWKAARCEAVHPQAVTLPSAAAAALLRRVAACAIALILAAGCATTQPRTAIDVEVTSAGVVLLDAKPVALNHLPKELKARGATRATAIYISVPENSSPTLLKELTESLVTGGLPRVMFTKPPKSSADPDTSK